MVPTKGWAYSETHCPQPRKAWNGWAWVTREDPDAHWQRGTGVWSCAGGRALKGGRHPINHGWDCSFNYTSTLSQENPGAGRELGVW